MINIINRKYLFCLYIYSLNFDSHVLPDLIVSFMYMIDD